MRARLTSSHLVGRVGELAELELAMRAATDGKPVLVLLGGDSGVGKTRLLAEFEQRLPEGVRALRGEAVEHRDGELPYAPLLGALRPLVRARHPVLDSISSGGRAQLAALIPGLDDGTQNAAPARPAQGPSAQLRLFEALLELLDLLSREEPLVVSLEDMHWADRSTRSFVSFLARSLRSERVLLLLSYRADELHRRHPLRPLLAELERLDRARRIELSPFDRAELAEALTDILGAPPSVELVERLFVRSEGNALYTEELLAAGLDGRGAAPQSLRDAFLLRIERLTETAQRVAHAIAVGRRLDEPTLAELTGLERSELQSALRESISEQVLVADEEGSFRFRHALLREALHDDLLPGERGELHLLLARIYEEHPAREDDREVERATLIAGHYAAAGDQPGALRAAAHAARSAREARAYGEAAGMAERALELWPRVDPSGRPEGLDLVGLLELAAGAHGMAGDSARSEALLQMALRELEAEDDPRRYAGLLARLSRAQWALNRGLESVETARRALALLAADDRGEERAELLAWLARTQFLRGRFREALHDAEEALAAAIVAGDRCEEGRVLNTLGMTQVCLGQVEEGIARLREALRIAEDADDVDDLSTAYANLSDMLGMTGRTREALQVAKQGMGAVAARGARRGHDWLSLTVSELAFLAGEWQLSWEALAPSPTELAGVLLMFRYIREAELGLGVGDEALARRCLEEARPLVSESSEPQWIGTFGALLGELHRREHDLPAARQAVARALDRIELCTDDVMQIARASAVGASIEADFAQRARDLREPAEEQEALQRADIHVQRLRAAAETGGPIACAWRDVGAAELARARGRRQPKLFERAARAWEMAERPYPTALMRWRQAETLVEAGEREAAAAPLADALQSAQRLGAHWLFAECRALSDRARVELPAADGEDGSSRRRASGDDDPFGLTPRERQVLSLVAQGATNRQIGSSLYMAEKTASVHVSRILAKLGVRSRTQAAAVAHRLELDR